MTGTFSLFVCVCVCVRVFVFVHKVVRAKSCPHNRKEEIKTKRQEGFLLLKSENYYGSFKCHTGTFAFLSYTLLSVFFSVVGLDRNGCAVALGNQIWTTVNHLVWFDRPYWQPLLLLLYTCC